MQTEFQERPRLAEQTDAEEIPDELEIPEELSRRKDWLEAIVRTKAIIEERTTQRFEQQQKEYEEKVTKRQAKAEDTGKRPRGRDPKPPVPWPRNKDQVNLTDKQSRIMPSSANGHLMLNPADSEESV